ncbi:MAG: glycosyltransferase family 1 protein [Bacillota bacterium]|nr:glycosyltransferase family 1 protein [Bacillota bacterium]
MRIVIDGRGAIRYRGTGIGTYTHQLAENVALTASACDTVVICLPQGAPPLPLEESLATGSAVEPRARVRCVRLSATERAAETAELADLCVRERADILHLPQNGRGLPDVPCAVVTTVHDLIPFTLPQTCSASYLRDSIRDMPWAMHRSDRIIAVSRSTAVDLREVLGIAAEKIAVVHEAPEEQYLAEISEDGVRKVTSKYGLTPGYILHVGGFNPRKNLALLLDAAARLLQDRSAAQALPQVVLSGAPGRDSSRLAQMISDCRLQGRVVMPGLVPVSDMPGLYGAAGLVCCPSLSEGFSLPLVEAMACGVPLVVSDIPAHREVAGDAALFFDPCDPAMMASKLALALSEPERRRALAASGRVRVRGYSWRRAAVETWLVYRWAVDQRGHLSA